MNTEYDVVVTGYGLAGDAAALAAAEAGASVLIPEKMPGPGGNPHHAGRRAARH